MFSGTSPIAYLPGAVGLVGRVALMRVKARARSAPPRRPVVRRPAGKPAGR